MNKHVETMLQKEMTRKEFLAALGLAVASLLGFSSILRLLGMHRDSVSEHGYGSHAYGK